MWIRIGLCLLLLLTPITIRNSEAQSQPNATGTRTDISVGATAIQVCPANAARVDCSCTNNDGATAVRVGNNQITPTRGQRVSGGGTFKATTTSAVFAVSEAGAVILSCTDQTR
jgi:hypothetical protein